MVSHLPTQTGYRYDETISSLQKSIRRGDEEGAMHWAVELVETFPSHLWNRLEVISHARSNTSNLRSERVTAVT